MKTFETLVLFCRLIFIDDGWYARMVKFYDSQSNAVISTEIVLHEYFNHVNFPYRRMQFTKEPLVRLSSVFYYSKESMVLRSRCNKRILWLQAHGLDVHYQRMFRGIKRDNIGKTAKVLQLEGISPVVRICAILLAIAFLVFLFEVFAYKFKIVALVMDYTTY